jgi:tetratricopeptide (TPR) repeat protein
MLGVAMARAGRGDRAIRLLDDGVARTTALGVNAYLARWTAYLAEGQLAAGQVDRARATAERARELAAAHRERGHEAEALLLLAEAEASADPEAAAGHRRDALTLAEELDLKPLAVRCHLSLAGPAAGSRERVTHLIEALDLGAGMDLGVWLDRAVSAFRRLGHLFVLPRDRAELHAFLGQRWAADPDVKVILDRRRGSRTRGVPPPGVIVVES